MIRKLIKMLTYYKRYNRIKNNIIKRANVCLYSTYTGKIIVTRLNLGYFGYNPCNGLRIKSPFPVLVSIGGGIGAIIRRDGTFNNTAEKRINKTSDGKNYFNL